MPTIAHQKPTWKKNPKYPRGVARNGNLYQAKINVGNRRRNLGTFATVEEAARAVDAAAKAIFGKDAILNYPDEVLEGFTEMPTASTLTKSAIPRKAKSKTVSIYCSADLAGEIETIATELALTVTETARQALKAGLPLVGNPMPPTTDEAAKPGLSDEVINALATYAVLSIAARTAPKSLVNRFYLEPGKIALEAVAAHIAELDAYLG